MPLDVETVSRAATGLVPGLVALVGLARGPGSLRAQLRHDLEILEKLPDESVGRALMLEHIADQVWRLNSQQTATRDVSGFVLGLIGAPGCGLLAIYLWQRQHWWGAPLAVFIGLLSLLFLYGIFDSGQRVPRDAKGKRLQASLRPRPEQ